MTLKALTRLIRARRKPAEKATHTPEEAREEQELLERIAAGIALNKMPPR